MNNMRPAPGTMARRQTRWKAMSNDDLKYALDLLSLHESPFEVDAANEIERRIHAGEWLDIDAAPLPHTELLPHWLKTWPFTLLYEQGRGSGTNKRRQS